MTKGRKQRLKKEWKLHPTAFPMAITMLKHQKTLRCPISRHEITLSNTKQAEFLHYRITAAKENRKILLQRWKSFKRS